MQVQIVGYTVADARIMEAASGDRWTPEHSDAADLIEFAGRACYQSWDRPNPATATVDAYLANIIKVQHFSVLEHGTVSVYAMGVSRSLTHELVRHRHFSYSQLSQRFVKLDAGDSDGQANDGPAFVVPPLFEGDPAAFEILWKVWIHAVEAYHALCDRGEELAMRNALPGSHVKQGREAARAVLPNMTPTALVVTGNHRSWREFLEKRGSHHADAEIRRFAVAMYHLLSGLEAAVYQDFTVTDVGGMQVVVRS